MAPTATDRISLRFFGTFVLLMSLRFALLTRSLRVDVEPVNRSTGRQRKPGFERHEWRGSLARGRPPSLPFGVRSYSAVAIGSWRQGLKSFYSQSMVVWRSALASGSQKICRPQCCMEHDLSHKFGAPFARRAPEELMSSTELSRCGPVVFALIARAHRPRSGR